MDTEKTREQKILSKEEQEAEKVLALQPEIEDMRFLMAEMLASNRHWLELTDKLEEEKDILDLTLPKHSRIYENARKVIRAVPIIKWLSADRSGEILEHAVKQNQNNEKMIQVQGKLLNLYIREQGLQEIITQEIDKGINKLKKDNPEGATELKQRLDLFKPFTFESTHLVDHNPIKNTGHALPEQRQALNNQKNYLDTELINTENLIEQHDRIQDLAILYQQTKKEINKLPAKGFWDKISKGVTNLIDRLTKSKVQKALTPYTKELTKVSLDVKKKYLAVMRDNNEKFTSMTETITADLKKLYNKENALSLAGDKFHKLRNEIAALEKAYQIRFGIKPTNVSEVAADMALSQQAGRAKQIPSAPDVSLTTEYRNNAKKIEAQHIIVENTRDARNNDSVTTNQAQYPGDIALAKNQATGNQLHFCNEYNAVRTSGNPSSSPSRSDDTSSPCAAGASLTSALL
ncbi:hypothetical protein [Candidatus Tisiphia endosymbiont of Beris chalybata]|uniref:hypothetical protein n=1 Tax=Candidatus Tisiphia endosymbiont of Beris chalybata TaxID=3066262 RepID=UPI00312C83DE